MTVIFIHTLYTFKTILHYKATLKVVGEHILIPLSLNLRYP